MGYCIVLINHKRIKLYYNWTGKYALTIASELKLNTLVFYL